MREIRLEIDDCFTSGSVCLTGAPFASPRVVSLRPVQSALRRMPASISAVTFRDESV
jgi:hypothetical protein